MQPALPASNVWSTALHEVLARCTASSTSQIPPSRVGARVVHTLDLPGQNATTDLELLELAQLEQRVVVTKDSDFVDSHVLRGEPHKLLLVSTGNISNALLEAVLSTHLGTLIKGFAEANWLELTHDAVIAHDHR